jgi:TatD DNase family protein
MVMDLCLDISIPGIVTFNKSESMQQVAREMPLEKMILETDGPFLAPVPYRGKTNKPEYLLHTAQKIADLRRISLDEVARQTTANAENLFRLPSGETGR